MLLEFREFTNWHKEPSKLEPSPSLSLPNISFYHNLPSIGTTDGSLIDGEMALLSTAAASARRPSALMGGVEDSFGRLAKLERPEEEGRAEVVSLLRSDGKPAEVGFRRAGALGSLAELFDPRAMKSPGGGWPGTHVAQMV